MTTADDIERLERGLLEEAERISDLDLEIRMRFLKAIERVAWVTSDFKKQIERALKIHL